MPSFNSNARINVPVVAVWVAVMTVNLMTSRSPRKPYYRSRSAPLVYLRSGAKNGREESSSVFYGSLTIAKSGEVVAALAISLPATCRGARR